MRATCSGGRPRLQETAPLLAPLLGGRADVFLATLKDGDAIMRCNVYLWQGSAKSPTARAKCDALLQDLIDDLTARENIMALMVGDLNALAVSYAVLRLPIREGRLVDVGAQAWP